MSDSVPCAAATLQLLMLVALSPWAARARAAARRRAGGRRHRPQRRTIVKRQQLRVRPTRTCTSDIKTSK